MEIDIPSYTTKYINDNNLWDSYWLKEKYPERFGGKKNLEWWKIELDKK